MGNSLSDNPAQPRLTTSAEFMYTKRGELILSVPNTPLNFNILKAITLTFLKTYSEENLFSYYHSGLKKFVDGYEFQRFSEFLGAFTAVAGSDCCASQSFLPTASSSPSAVDIQDQGLGPQLRVVDMSRFRPSIDINRLSNTLGRTHDLVERVEKFLEAEICKKNNFFFEFSLFFGELFAARYQSDLRNFEKTCNDLKKKTQKHQQALKEEIKGKYEQARQDLRHFQNILEYIIKSFVVQTYSNMNQNSSLTLRKLTLERLSLQLVFGKNKCYSTYFELIKYHVRDQEADLKNSIEELKDLKPEDFKVEAKLCMKDSDAPYQKVIDSLNYLDVYTSPLDKFKAIADMNKELAKEIRKISPEPIVLLTAEKLIPIYCYCLVQSRNFNMKRHQVFMDDFICQDLMNLGDDAYSFITFIASAGFLISIADNPLKKLRYMN